MPGLKGEGGRPDLRNAVLLIITAAAIFALAVYFGALQPALPKAWSTPGSPELYIVGVAGAVLLLVPMAFAITKRTGIGGSPPAWFVAHVLGGTAGAVLVIIHSAGFLRRPPALLFLCIAALVFVGLWGRIRIARHMAATFASKQMSFALATRERRERLAPIIEAKRRLLAHLDGEASEATFSLRVGHWIRKPRMSLEYQRLVREEAKLVGARSSEGVPQRYWRAFHIAMAYLLVLGLLIHVVTVTFFAGYVADGGPITWWHLTAW